MKNIFTLLVLLLLTATLWSQSPEKMNYQAVIRDSKSNLLFSKQIGMQISILQESEDGISVYTETQTPTTNANGLVSILIGTGTTNDNFSEIDWSTGIYFIKTEIDTAGGLDYSLTAISQLLSVPYSLHAKTAESVTGPSGVGQVSVLTTEEIFAFTPVKGDAVFNITENIYQVFNGSTWQSFVANCWPAPTSSDAGVDQILTTETTTISLSGNQPAASHGIGEWTIVSGEEGSLEDASSPTTNFTGAACSAYTLRWTISTSCDTSSDEVDVEFNHTPTISNAGSDQTFTDGTTTTPLSGNAPEEGHGTGEWTIVSGAGGSFADATSPTTTLTGDACSVYTLRWTISTGCDTSSDEVDIVFNQTSTAATAGPDQTFIDGTTSIELSGNTPEEGHGTGEWTIVSGEDGSFDDASSPNTTFAGSPCSVYTLRWTISASCDSSFDEVDIVFNQTPTEANAGSDQTFTDGTISIELSGNTIDKGHGTGEWTIVSGEGGSFADATLPTTTFTGKPCTDYKLRWTISASCDTTFDEVNIAFNQIRTLANAGADKTYENGTTTTTLSANSPEVGHGTGEWTIISGEGGSFADASSNITTFTGELYQIYTLRWTISTPCNSSKDDVQISFIQDGPGPDLSDVENNTYSTVSIGKQLWMAENLKVTKYADGTSIDIITDDIEWGNLEDNDTDKGCCFYNNNEADAYGALYTYAAATNSTPYVNTDVQGVCPDGWHLPTDDEWKQLELYIGLSPDLVDDINNRGDDEGQKLRSTTGWDDDNGTDEYGFTALPGGYRGGFRNTFAGLGRSGAWWSSSSNNSSTAWHRSISSVVNNVTRNYFPKAQGISVRCVRD